MSEWRVAAIVRGAFIVTSGHQKLRVFFIFFYLNIIIVVFVISIPYGGRITIPSKGNDGKSQLKHRRQRVAFSISQNSGGREGRMEEHRRTAMSSVLGLKPFETRFFTHTHTLMIMAKIRIRKTCNKTYVEVLRDIVRSDLIRRRLEHSRRIGYPGNLSGRTER